MLPCVIPASAGGGSASGGKAGIQVKKIRVWIPAFAGMTQGSVSSHEKTL